MARIKLFLAFVALVILAGGIVAVAYYWEKIARPNWHVTQNIETEKKGRGKNHGPDLGIREYQAAVELLKEGELQGARDRLYYLMKFYPDSESYPEAKRVIGEINMDLLISKLPIEGKEEHVVRKGDLGLAPIARKYGCTIDYIMRANGRTRPTIYPNDRLTVYPLQFGVEIDLSEKALVVNREDGTFFKEFAIRNINLPPVLKTPVSTEIDEKVAWYEGRSVGFTSKNYLNCEKWIRTKKMGLFIRVNSPDSGSENDGESSSTYGVMIDRADIEELFTILRLGTPVSMVE